ncbi:MAG TPA: hypothetical protein PKA41_08990 [Verrucomicrobiota bacterium]|nr:hypothetical protein [Verrucomicrobiota bacterium]
MIIGINTTKNAAFIAETSDEKNQFEVQKVTRLQYELSGALELEDLYKTLKTILVARATRTSAPLRLCG